MVRLLVVDDNEDACELLARILRRTGYEVTCQTSAADALRYLDTETPDLVVLDVMMPGMTGLDVLKSVRADARLAGVPIVIYTALSDEKTRTAARALGASGYVVKGGGWPDLHAEIVRHIGPAGSQPAPTQST